MGADLVTMAGRGADGEGVGGGGGNAGSESAKINIQIIDRKRKGDKNIVDVLKAGFE